MAEGENNKMSKRLERAIKQLGIREPGSSDETISQQKLRNFEALKDERRAINQKYQETLRDMKEVIKSGASVATGKRVVEGVIIWRRHPSYKKVVIDRLGEAVQKQVLARTPYRPYYRMRFFTKNGTTNGKENQ